MPYTIEDHKHRFAAWAAGSAASVKGCRFSVMQAKTILETAGLKLLLGNPDNLPLSDQTDIHHRGWRDNVIQAAQAQGLAFTHGIAAKLINIYFKAGFVCGGYHNHERVCSLHPPIDSLLLDELAARNVGGFRRVWNEARKIRWSNFNSEQYETVIGKIREAMLNNALWEVERYWRGYR